MGQIFKKCVLRHSSKGTHVPSFNRPKPSLHWHFGLQFSKIPILKGHLPLILGKPQLSVGHKGGHGAYCSLGLVLQLKGAAKILKRVMKQYYIIEDISHHKLHIMFENHLRQSTVGIQVPFSERLWLNLHLQAGGGQGFGFLHLLLSSSLLGQ